VKYLVKDAYAKTMCAICAVYIVLTSKVRMCHVVALSYPIEAV